MTPEGAWRPKKPKFKLSKESFYLDSSGIIDTNSIYINVRPSIRQGETVNDTTFLRFYANGRLFIGKNDLYSNSDKSIDYNNFYRIHSRIGYYNLSHDSLEIETFNVNLGGARGDVGYYMRSCGYVKHDSILIFNYSRSEMFYSEGTPDHQKKFRFVKANDRIHYPLPTKENSTIYIRKKVEGLKGTPDW